MDRKFDIFSLIIERIYEAGFDPEKWPYVLLDICKYLDAEKALMLYLDPEEYLISFACGYGFDPYRNDIGAGRFRRFIFDDPVACYGISHLNEVFSDRRVIPEKTLHRSEMHKYIRCPENMEFMLTVFLQDGADGWSAFCFFRGINQKCFSTKDEHKLKKFTNHLSRSTYIHKNTVGADNLKHMHNMVLDELAIGIIIVNEQHNVIVCNKKSRAVIKNSKILSLHGKRIHCESSKETLFLYNAINRALEINGKTSKRQRIAVRLRDRTQTEVILAVITPLQSQSFEENLNEQMIAVPHFTAKIPCKKNALITLCDPADYRNGTQELLQQLFGLTPAESALADCLADDFSLEEAAKKLGRKVGTARVQLQAIFTKTDTNRQSSLIKLITSIP